MLSRISALSLFACMASACAGDTDLSKTARELFEDGASVYLTVSATSAAIAACECKGWVTAQGCQPRN